MEHSVPAQAAPVYESALSPLREPLFRGLWIAAVISYTGSWMQSIATGWLMTSLTNSPMLVALVQVVVSVPVFLMALPAGALADSIDRRKFLLATQIFMTAAAAMLGALTIMGAVTPQLLLALTFLLGAGAAMNEPAWQSMAPELVPSSKLAAAIALNSVGFNIARSVGPAIGGLVIAIAGSLRANSERVGSGAVFLLNALSFLGVILFLYRWTPEKRELPPKSDLGTAIGSGLRYVRNDQKIRAVLVRTLAFTLMVSAFWALLPLIARKYGAGGYGAMVGCFGVGALFSAGLLPRLRSILRFDAIAGFGSIVFAIATFGLARSHTLALSSFFTAGAGLAYVGTLSTFNVVAQTAAPSWVRARVMSMYILALQGGFAIGSAMWGGIASRIGIESTLTVSGAALCCGLILSAWFKLSGEEGSQGSPPPPVEIQPD
jgi:MFS family permease